MHLLREVEKFLRESDVAPTRFGRKAVGDPRFVFDLRNGRDPRPQTIAKVRAYLDSPMMRMAMSAAATALLRALIVRAGVQRDRILLSEWHSIDWQSLTFVGERHRCSLRIQGPDSYRIAARLAGGLADAEFEIPGHILADVTVIAGPTRQGDGATMLSIEALTIADDLA